MKIRTFLFPLLIFIFVSTACGLPASITQKLSRSTDSTSTDAPPPAKKTPAPAALSDSDGAFSADATSPISVELGWDSLSADAYRIEISVGGGDFVPYLELAGDAHSYEDFPVPSDSRLAYRLIPVNGGKDGKALEVTVQTPPQTPNPLTVTLAQDITMPDINNMDFSNFNFENIDPQNFDPNDLGLMPTPASASQEIGPDGGQLSVTGTSGAEYTYTIPAGAVDDTFVFTLKVISGMEGAPLSGGLLGAVLVEPVGLDLDVPAVLTITPPPDTTISSDEVLSTFSFNPDGSEFYFTGAYGEGDPAASASAMKLAAPVKNGGWVMQPWDIPQNRTAPAGTGKTTRSAIRQNAAEHPPTDRDSQIKQNDAAEDSDLTPLIPSAYLEMNQRSQTLTGWTDTIALMEEMDTRYTNAADKQQVLEWMETSIQNLILQFEKNFKRNLENCVSKDDFDAYFAAKTLKSPRAAFTRLISQRYQKTYGTDTIDKVIKKAANCNLRLKIDSTATISEPGIKMVLSITSEVPLKINYDYTNKTVYYTGHGRINYETDNIQVGKCTGNYQGKTKGQFIVNKLRPEFGASSTTLTDFNILDYTTPGVTENIRFYCPDYTSSTPIPAGNDMWGSYFFAARFENPGINDFHVQVPPVSGTIGTTSPHDIRQINPGSLDVSSTFTLVVNAP